MSAIFDFDAIDLQRFAPVALRTASKKSFLHERDGLLWNKRFFVLFGNLLYRFEREDASKLVGIEFLEYSTVRATTVSDEHSYCISISKCGGKTIVLSATNESERQSWIEIIESSKFIAITRRLEDSEASSVQLHHRVEQQELQNTELDRALIETSRELDGAKICLQNQELRIHSLEGEVTALNIKECLCSW